MSTYCNVHDYAYHGLPIDECPVCVREERDMMRSQLDEASRLIKALREERDRMRDDVAKIHAALGNGIDEDRWPPGTSAVDALIAERDRLRIIVRGLEEETADKTMWRDEAVRLRDLIPQAWDAGEEFIKDNICNPTYMVGSPSKKVWLKQKGLA